MASPDVRFKPCAVIEFRVGKTVKSVDIHRRSFSVYGYETPLDISSVRRQKCRSRYFRSEPMWTASHGDGRGSLSECRRFGTGESDNSAKNVFHQRYESLQNVFSAVSPSLGTEKYR